MARAQKLIIFAVQFVARIYSKLLMFDMCAELITRLHFARRPRHVLIVWLGYILVSLHQAVSAVPLGRSLLRLGHQVALVVLLGCFSPL